jgi:hypothetical protein
VLPEIGPVTLKIGPAGRLPIVEAGRLRGEPWTIRRLAPPLREGEPRRWLRPVDGERSSGGEKRPLDRRGARLTFMGPNG